MSIKYAYLIRRTDTDDPAERRTLAAGTRVLAADTGTIAFAEDRVLDARRVHSYYDGPLTVWVWPHQDGDSLMPCIRGGEPPAHAEEFGHGHGGAR